MTRLFVAFFMALTVLIASAQKPSPAELRSQAEVCRQILDESLVKFYLPACLDKENGGYKEFLKENQFVLGGEKFLTLQARQLWFFSTLATHNVRSEESLAAAKHGFRFLRDKMHDKQHGGYFSKVTDDGKTKDPRKHVYLNAFALYSFAAYYGASKDAEALKAAQGLFKILQKKAYDQKHGGYIEFFHPDWREVTETNASGFVGAIGHKTYNTHLHVMEAFAELFRVWPDQSLKKALTETILINTSTVLHPDVNANVDAWSRDWKMITEPRNLRASYGHDVECIWLVMDAAHTAGINKGVLLPWAQALAANSIAHGYDQKHGGFYAGGELNKPADDRRKTWWIQAEALPGMLEMYRLTGNQQYYDIFKKTLEFCHKYQVAKEGSWWATRAEDGSPTNDLQRSSPWQGAYHAGRAMVVCAQWLDELAAAK